MGLLQSIEQLFEQTLGMEPGLLSERQVTQAVEVRCTACGLDDMDFYLRSLFKNPGEPKARASRAWARRLNTAISSAIWLCLGNDVPRPAQPRDGQWGF
jgi:hypothetical protein